MGHRAEGPTPAGGAYSVAVGLDATGEETDDLPSAHTVVITEYDEDGQQIARTYAGHVVDTDEDARRAGATLAGWGEAQDPDAADMGKETWDVRSPATQLPVETLTDLLDALGWGAMSRFGLRSALANLTVSPSWNAAPEGLRRQVEEFLAG